MRNRANMLRVHATVLASVLGWQQPPEPPLLIDLLQRQVHAEAERLKRQLADLEAETDFGPLLERKLTVDASLIPALLLEDAARFCEAVDADREPPDLLWLLRAEHGAAPVHATWSDARGPSRIARALAGWATPAEGVSACIASTASLRATPGESAPFILWSVHVARADGEVSVAAQAHWHEPCLESVNLDWPLLPHALRVTWDAHAGSIVTGAGERHAESWPPSPQFNNPGDVYALFDALRSRRCADARVERAPDSGEATHPAKDPHSNEHEVVRTLHRADGTLVRTERWSFQGEQLARLTIEQPPLRVRHHAAEAFEIRREVEGVAIGDPEVIQPTMVLAHPPRGLALRVDFRPADPTRDALPDVRGVAVPAEITVHAGGAPRARITLLGLASGAGSDGRASVDRALAGWQAAADASARARRHAMQAVDAACANGDATRVRLECEHLALLARADDVPEAWAMANVAACRRRLRAAGYPIAAAELQDDAIGTSPRSNPSANQDQERVDGADRVNGDPAHARSEARPELDPNREAFVAALCDGVRRGLGSRRHTHALQASVAATAVRAMREAPPEAQPAIERLTPIVGDDLCALVHLGIGEFAAVHEAEPPSLAAPSSLAKPSLLPESASLDTLCRQFSARLHAALQTPAPTGESRSQLRSAIRTGADAARDVARTLAIARGGTPSSADVVAQRARAGVLQLEPLAGNCLEPSLIGAWIVGASHADLAARAREGSQLHMALRALDAMPGDGRIGARRDDALADAVAGAMRGVLCAPTAARLRVERPAEAPAVRP